MGPALSSPFGIGLRKRDRMDNSMELAPDRFEERGRQPSTHAGTDDGMVLGRNATFSALVYYKRREQSVLLWLYIASMTFLPALIDSVRVNH